MARCGSLLRDSTPKSASITLALFIAPHSFSLWGEGGGGVYDMYRADSNILVNNVTDIMFLAVYPVMQVIFHRTQCN